MSSIRKEIDITYKSITSFFILQLIIGALSIKTEPLILISYLFAYLLQFYIYINENLLLSNALSLKLLGLLLFYGKRDKENKQLLFELKRYIFFILNI